MLFAQGGGLFVLPDLEYCCEVRDYSTTGNENRVQVLLYWKTQSVVKHQDSQGVLDNCSRTISPFLSLVNKFSDELGRFEGEPYNLIVVFLEFFINSLFLLDALIPNDNALYNLNPVFA